MKRFAAMLPVCLLAAGCASYDDFYRLDENYLSRRQAETRQFDTNDEEKMLVASSQVLQDLEFTLEMSETGLGLLSAVKEREVKPTAGTVALVALAALSGTPAVYDVGQKIYVTLATTKRPDGNGYNARVSFARIIWNNMNETRIERIEDPEIYQEFFGKLDQSLFLTANNL